MGGVTPQRSEVYYAHLDPVVGHEQGGTRLVLVVSADEFNAGTAELVMVVPLTTRRRRIASRVTVEPPEGGVSRTSQVRCEDIRSISKQQLAGRLGAVSGDTMARVEEILRTLMGL